MKIRKKLLIHELAIETFNEHNNLRVSFEAKDNKLQTLLGKN